MPSTGSLDFWQGATALGFAAFVIPHVTNTGLAYFGESTYDGVQASLRSVYKHPAAEAFFWGCAAVHGVLSAYKYYKNYGTKKNEATTLKKKLHRYGGFTLLILTGIHIKGCNDFFIQFGGMAYIFKHMAPFSQIYLTILGLAGAVHTGLGINRALQMCGISRKGITAFGQKVLTTYLSAAILIGIAAFWGYFEVLPSYEQHPFAVHARSNGMVPADQ